MSRLRWGGSRGAMDEYYAAMKKVREARKGRRTVKPKATTNDGDELLSVSAAAALLGVTVPALHEMRRMKIVPYATRSQFGFRYSRVALEQIKRGGPSATSEAA
jgi:hypothetical protein